MEKEIYIGTFTYSMRDNFSKLCTDDDYDFIIHTGAESITEVPHLHIQPANQRKTIVKIALYTRKPATYEQLKTVPYKAAEKLSKTFLKWVFSVLMKKNPDHPTETIWDTAVREAMRAFPNATWEET